MEKTEEITYSIGDRFKNGNGNKYLLTVVDYNLVQLTNLSTGWRWAESVGAKNTERITRTELNEITSYALKDFTRYFSYQDNK